MDFPFSSMGERLDKTRSILGMKQKAFAEAINVSRSALNTYLSGARPVPTISLHALSIKYGIDPVWIIEGDGENGLTSQENVFFERIEEIESHLQKRMEERNILLTIERKWKVIRSLYASIKLNALNGNAENNTLFLETEKALDMVS